jgi:hypothetical protein
MIDVEALMNHIIDSKPNLAVYKDAYKFGYLCSIVNEICVRFPDAKIVLRDHADFHNFKED